MNFIIFSHHPNPTVAQSDKYTAVQMRAGKHWRPVYVRTELFSGTAEEAQKYAEKTSAAEPGEMILKVTPYEA